MPDYRPPRKDRPLPRRQRLPTEKGDKSFPGNRLAKVIARAGLASRRDAEAFITSGRVSVNGRIVDTPALNVLPSDIVLVDGVALPNPERTRLFLYHKPRGRITTEHDPEGRPTVFDDLPAQLPRLLAVGRLDFNTEGLLLLTNDGGLKRLLELPATGWLRRYRVRAFGRADDQALAALADGLTVDGISYGPVEAQIERVQGDNVWLILGLREGKNREVRIILQHLGLEVNRLIRVSYGPFQLGEIEAGDVMEVPRRRLRDQLGPRLADEAGVDFDGPVHQRQPAPRPEPVEAREPYRKRPGIARPERSGEPPAGAGRATAKAERFAGMQDRAVHQPRQVRKPSRYDGPKVERDAATGTLSAKPKTIADRKGRAVLVARKSAGADAHTDGERKPRVSKRPFRDAPAPRPQAAERGERPMRSEGFRDRPARPARSEGFRDRPPRRDGEEGGRKARASGDRPARPARSEGFRDRPPRRDGEKGGRKAFDKPWRPARAPGEAAKPRGFAGARSRPPKDGPAAGRSRDGGGPRRPGPGGDKPRGPRPPRRGV